MRPDRTPNWEKDRNFMARTASGRHGRIGLRRMHGEHAEAAHPPIGAIENDRGRGYRFVPATQ